MPFQKYAVNMELADYENVLAIVTYANTREEIDRLISACRSISQELLSDTCVINRNWKKDIQSGDSMPATTGNDTETGVFCTDAENPLGTGGRKDCR